MEVIIVNNKAELLHEKKPKTGEYGDFYVSVVSTHNGQREIYVDIESKAETINKARENSNDEYSAHPYEYNSKTDTYTKIPIMDE